jgi:chemotaxis protein MotB
MQEVAKRIQKEFSEAPALTKLAKTVQVKVTNEGLRVELIDQVDGTFFDIGSATPNENLRRAVEDIVHAMANLDNEVVIEGHTDARPYVGGLTGYSNWELSADRGNAVRRLMTTYGFPTQRITEVRAYAETIPLPNADPIDARNRRVSILLQSRFANVPDIPPPGATPQK